MARQARPAPVRPGALVPPAQARRRRSVTMALALAALVLIVVVPAAVLRLLHGTGPRLLPGCRPPARHLARAWPGWLDSAACSNRPGSSMA